MYHQCGCDDTEEVLKLSLNSMEYRRRSRRGGYCLGEWSRPQARTSCPNEALCCVICLADIAINERYTFAMPCCHHPIHLECWERWAWESQQSPCCPMCRSPWDKDIICNGCLRPWARSRNVVHDFEELRCWGCNR